MNKLIWALLGSALLIPTAQAKPEEDKPDREIELRLAERTDGRSASLGMVGYREEQAKRIQSAEVVGALGDDLFGEQINLYTGATEFVHTDLDVPGNGSLPVRLSRRLSIDGLKDRFSTNGAGDWEIEAPYLGGTFLKSLGWQVDTNNPFARCTSPTKAISDLSTINGASLRNGAHPPAAEAFRSWEYWHGYQMHVPGAGTQGVLFRAPGMGAPQPVLPQVDGVSSDQWRWITKDFWHIRCLGQLESFTNGVRDPGEGFLAIAPDGTQYFFNYQARMPARSVRKTIGTLPNGSPQQPWVHRDEIRLYATQVRDRFGNSVSYQWSRVGGHDNAPHANARLDAIVASDGRRIDLTWSNQRVQRARTSDGARERTVDYGYRGSGTLQHVTQADGSRWELNLDDVYARRYVEFAGQSSWDHSVFCGSDIHLSGEVRAGQIVHPSGATGSFQFRWERHHRANVPGNACTFESWGDPEPGDLRFITSEIPLVFDVLAIQRKQISGPGLPSAYTWTFSYPRETMTPSEPVGVVRRVQVNQPDGSRLEYVFGNRYEIDEGQLRRVDLTQNGVLRNQLLNFYVGNPVGAWTQPFPDRVGASPHLKTDKFSAERLRPLFRRATVRDGVSFQNWVQSFDQFANPVSVLRMSSLGQRSETLAYHHNLSRWVIGQVASVTENSTGAVMESTTYNDTQVLPIQRHEFGKLVGSFSYHADGQLNTFTDGRNHTTTLLDYFRGVPRTVRFHDNTHMTAWVNGLGQVTSLTDPLGNTTQYAYDLMGRLARVTYPTADSVAWSNRELAFNRQTSSLYGLPAGHWQRVETVGSRRITTHYDALLRPVVVREFDHQNTATPNRFRVFHYDHAGRQTFASYPQAQAPWSFASLGTGVSTQYDPLGRTTRITQTSELGNLVTRIDYNTGFQKVVTNPRGFATTYTFRALDEPSEAEVMSIRAPEWQNTDYTRDVFGKVRSIQRSGWYNGPNGWESQSSARHFVYDAHQQLCKRIDPEHGATVFDYDAAGNLAWSADGLSLPSTSQCNRESVFASQRVQRSYDSLNRLTQVLYPDSSDSLHFTYFADGLVQQARVGNGGSAVTWIYGYNKRRLLESEQLSVDGRSFSLQHRYNARGDASRLQYPDGEWLDYLPDALGRPTTLAGTSGSYASNIGFHANGQLSGFTYGNGALFSQSLNARGLPLLRQDTRNTWTRILHHTFAYDANANVSSILDGAGSQADYTDDSRWLGYDGLDRLTVANSRDQNARMQWGYGWGEASFEYDALYNLRRFRMGPLDLRYHHDSQQRLQGITLGGAAFRSYAHNARGQMTQREHADRQYSLSWDSAHRLLSTQAPGHSESYRYDAHGHRVRTQRSGETVWSVYSRAGTLLFEQTSLGQNRRHIHLGARQVAETRNGQRRYLHTDHLGTPRVQTDAFGTVVQRDVRAPYGSVLAGFDYRQGAGFTGHMEDGATALTYMKARYYDPVAMRFLSPDPVYVDLGTGGNFNRYWYANNNPYKFVDPDGRYPCVFTPPAPVCAAAAAKLAGGAGATKGGAGILAAGGVALGGTILVNNAVDSLVLNEAAQDTAVSAGEKIREGTVPAAGASGKKGEREGAGGQAGADGAFDSVSGTNERSPRDGVRVKDLEGGGTIETHGATKNPDYPQGTPTVKVQDASGRPISTVRYPKESP